MQGQKQKTVAPPAITEKVVSLSVNQRTGPRRIETLNLGPHPRLSPGRVRRYRFQSNDGSATHHALTMAIEAPLLTAQTLRQVGGLERPRGRGNELGRREACGRHGRVRPHDADEITPYGIPPDQLVKHVVEVIDPAAGVTMISPGEHPRFAGASSAFAAEAGASEQARLEPCMTAYERRPWSTRPPAGKSCSRCSNRRLWRRGWPPSLPSLCATFTVRWVPSISTETHRGAWTLRPRRRLRHWPTSPLLIPPQCEGAHRAPESLAQSIESSLHVR